jgi:hypothetical protein
MAQNITTFSILRPSQIQPILDFWYENRPFATQSTCSNNGIYVSNEKTALQFINSCIEPYIQPGEI